MNEEELKNKDNILYRPELDYDKKYDSIGSVEPSFENIGEEEEDNSLLDDIIENIENIKQVLPLLTDEMQSIVNKPLAVVDKVIGDTDVPPGKPDPGNEQLIITTEKKEDDDDDVYPETFFRDDDDPFEIIVKKKDNITYIKDSYNYDLTSIIADYIIKVNQVMNNYLNNIFQALKPLDVSLYSKVLENCNIHSSEVSKDYRHLSDLIIRSQITRKMKIRMYNKLYNLDKSIAHIRNCKAGVEQRLRYYEAQYQDAKSYNDLLSNRFLENSRMMYDKKYKQNFFNLYKYLNSSVILLEECFEMYINEAQAKIILLMKEGNELW